jgi:hypothetical protein
MAFLRGTLFFFGFVMSEQQCATTKGNAIPAVLTGLMGSLSHAELLCGRHVSMKQSCAHHIQKKATFDWNLLMIG